MEDGSRRSVTSRKTHHLSPLVLVGHDVYVILFANAQPAGLFFAIPAKSVANSREAK